MKFFRLLFKTLLFVLLIILVIVFFNALTKSSQQPSVESIQAVDVPEQSISRFSESIKLTTVSYPDHIDTAAFIAFKNLLVDHYPLVDSFLERTVINEYSLVYKWPGKKQSLAPILLMGHIDIVPVESESKQKWTKAPYSGLVEDGVIWGRGTLDDKLSILGALEAVELLLSTEYQPERSIYFAFGHDEEVGGKNGAQAIAKWFSDQNIRFEYVLDEGSVILENALPGMEKPAGLIGIGEKGYLTLDLQVQLSEGGHSSMPPKESAIGILGKTIHTLEQNPFPPHLNGVVQELLENAGPEMEWPHRLIFTNYWLFRGVLKNQFSQKATTNAIIRTTLAPTIINAGIKDNVMPTEATATINFRIIPGETTTSVMDYVKRTIADERVNVSVGNSGFSSDPSPFSARDGFGYGVIQKTILEVFPKVVVLPSLVVAGTDSRHFTHLSDNVYRFTPMVLQGSDLKRIHGVDECIHVDNYKNVIRFYHQLLLNSTR